jgi:hypothetical protein
LYFLQPAALNAVHGIEDFFLLAFDHNADLLTERSQLIRHVPEIFLAAAGVHYHHHIEIALHDRLRDVENVDPVLRQIGADSRYDSYRIFSDYCDNRFFHTANHAFPSPAASSHPSRRPAGTTFEKKLSYEHIKQQISEFCNL